MNVFLINLDRAPDRRAHMLSELSRLLPDIEVQRALCVDIKAPDWTPPAEFTPGRWMSDRWDLPASDIEIFRSHMDCWKRIAASGQPGLVLEDDLLFSDDFGRIASELMANAPKGIVRLDAVATPMLRRTGTATDGGYQLNQIKTLAPSAAAYVVDPDTAADMAATARIERTVDDYLFDPDPAARGARGHTHPIYQIEPAVAVQAQFGSYADSSRDIPDFLKATKRTDARTRKDRRFSGPLLYRLRKEILRMRHRKKAAAEIKKADQSKYRWGRPDLNKQLRWD